MVPCWPLVGIKERTTDTLCPTQKEASSVARDQSACNLVANQTSPGALINRTCYTLAGGVCAGDPTFPPLQNDYLIDLGASFSFFSFLSSSQPIQPFSTMSVPTANLASFKIPAVANEPMVSPIEHSAHALFARIVTCVNQNTFILFWSYFG